MTSKHLGIATTVLLLDTALLLIVGVSMWSGAAYPVDAAVGKGLVTLAAVVGVPTITFFLAFLNSLPRMGPTPSRSDWDNV